ncbi:hypothetical protein [Micromonospora sp. NPDC050200]|uniref:hypothetical protein n=1 Tax=Micromonospora sp. NPDC050200 TaxID=3155664 RepID=UPI00340DB8A5
MAAVGRTFGLDEFVVELTFGRSRSADAVSYAPFAGCRGVSQRGYRDIPQREPNTRVR